MSKSRHFLTLTTEHQNFGQKNLQIINTGFSFFVDFLLFLTVFIRIHSFSACSDDLKNSKTNMFSKKVQIHLHELKDFRKKTLKTTALHNMQKTHKTSKKSTFFRFFQIIISSIFSLFRDFFSIFMHQTDQNTNGYDVIKERFSFLIFPLVKVNNK